MSPFIATDILIVHNFQHNGYLARRNPQNIQHMFRYSDILNNFFSKANRAIIRLTDIYHRGILLHLHICYYQLYHLSKLYIQLPMCIIGMARYMVNIHVFRPTSNRTEDRHSHKILTFLIYFQ